MFNLTPFEFKKLKSLTTPIKIQNFLDRLRYNFETDGETCMSPRRVMNQRRAHCIEGAMLAALVLRLHGERPLLLDLTAAAHDLDHVVALYKRNGYWGAISKTNHAVLRFRDPVYRTIRELALSYFHEYTDDVGRKTLRSYSRPMDLAHFDHLDWATSNEGLWEIAHALNDIPHYKLVTQKQLPYIRNADATERRAGEIVEWKKPTVKR